MNPNQPLYHSVIEEGQGLGTLDSREQTDSQMNNKKLRKNEYDLKIQRKYGITVNEVLYALFSWISLFRNYANSTNANGPSSPRNYRGNMASDWPTTPSGKGEFLVIQVRQLFGSNHQKGVVQLKGRRGACSAVLDLRQTLQLNQRYFRQLWPRSNKAIS